MDLNKFVFPAPASTYTAETLKNIVWIPRSRFFSMKVLMQETTSLATLEHYLKDHKHTKESAVHIPCHFHKYAQECKNTILYFHGNAEDLGMGEPFIKRLSAGLKMNVLSVEYPGYGIYEGKPTEETILEDAEIVYDFLLSELGIKPENIILLGRSLGSAAATHLAAHRKPKALLLISPFTSIKDVVKTLSNSIVSQLVADRFKNIETIKKVECPIFFVHGKKDKLIPIEHTISLLKNCKARAKSYLPEDMNHNEFNIITDVVQPIRSFFGEIGIVEDRGNMQLPSYIMTAPAKKYESKANAVSKIVDSILVKY